MLLYGRSLLSKKRERAGTEAPADEGVCGGFRPVCRGGVESVVTGVCDNANNEAGNERECVGITIKDPEEIEKSD